MNILFMIISIIVLLQPAMAELSYNDEKSIIYCY